MYFFLYKQLYSSETHFVIVGRLQGTSNIFDIFPCITFPIKDISRNIFAVRNGSAR